MRLKKNKDSMSFSIMLQIKFFYPYKEIINKIIINLRFVDFKTTGDPNYELKLNLN